MQKEKYYTYRFSNGFVQKMTPIEAHKYAYSRKTDILDGPNYQSGKKQRSFTGWGWHDSLKMSFRGPQHYRDYLKAHGIEELGDTKNAPLYPEIEKPLWDEDLIRKAINHYGINIGSVMAEALLSGELDYPEDAPMIDVNTSQGL